MQRNILLWILLMGTLPARSQTPATYPRIGGYVGIVHPFITFGNGSIHSNFDGSYTVGMPTGINNAVASEDALIRHQLLSFCSIAGSIYDNFAAPNVWEILHNHVETSAKI